MELTLNEIISATKAKTKIEKETRTITGVSTDTRTIQPGELFVALSGEHFDGTSYAQEALDKGAIGVVAHRQHKLPLETTLGVKDTRVALLQIAGLWRKKQHAKVIAITGSVGKTTTKEMMALVTETKGRTLKTKENLNNEVGLSQMLFQLDDSYDYAVLELGVDGPGQMLPMALAVEPNIGIITTIGDSHLANFGSHRKLISEKLTLKKGLALGGTMVLNGDDPVLAGKVRGVSNMYFALHSLSAEVQATDVVVHNDATEFMIRYKTKKYPVRLPIAGYHQVSNALAAFTGGMILGIAPEAAIQALESYQPEGLRQFTRVVRGITLVEDCYNASPQSMTAALETLAQMDVKGRKLALLGDMLELGSTEKEAHFQIGVFAAQQGLDGLFLTGELSKEIQKGAEQQGMEHVFYEKDSSLLGEHIKEYLQPGDLLWVKASRGMRLEKILQQIYQED